jgi:hypothetical protein
MDLHARKLLRPSQKLFVKASKRFQKILNRFKTLFREKLPERLPPKRDIEHIIDTRDISPVNINAYSLSPVRLREQAQQIVKIFKQELIRESASF